MAISDLKLRPKRVLWNSITSQYEYVTEDQQLAELLETKEPKPKKPKLPPQNPFKLNDEVRMKVGSLCPFGTAHKIESEEDVYGIVVIREGVSAVAVHFNPDCNWYRRKWLQRASDAWIKVEHLELNILDPEVYI